MNLPTVAISDVHGCFKTLMALLAKVDEELGAGQYRLVLLGDQIDRGPRSRQVVEWAMANKVECLRGNHEDLALAYSPHIKLGYEAKCAEYYDRDVWLYNGGDKALESWGIHDCSPLPRDVLDWMANLPTYIVDIPDDKGLKLLLSHTGYGLSADTGHWMSALWGRHSIDGGDFPKDGYYRVFGHTQELSPNITSEYAMIDTGCAYHERGMGNLTAFIWPSKDIISVPYCD